MIATLPAAYRRTEWRAFLPFIIIIIIIAVVRK